MYCSDKIMSRPIIPNTSHLHKVTPPTHNIPTQSQIPKKMASTTPTGKLQTESTSTIGPSVVNSFLHSVNKTSPQVYKTHHTLKLSTGSNESSPPPPVNNHFAGLKKVNGSESAVQNRVRNLNREMTKNGTEEPESVVVFRTKSATSVSATDRGGRSYLPPKPETQPTERNSSADDKKWKAKYEDAERRRKELLSESQKLSREKTSLEQKLKKLEEDHKQLKNDFNDKTQQLNQLRRVSEQVYQDYDKLNNKYETETTTLHKALEVASKTSAPPEEEANIKVHLRYAALSGALNRRQNAQNLTQWYKENKKLKRESVALRSSMMFPPNFEVIKDEPDGEDSQGHDELEELRKTVQELSSQVGQLQSELNKARLQEFEAQEQFINLTQALDAEKTSKEKMEQELKTLRLMKDKFESVSYMVHDEMKALRTERDRATEAASRLQAEAQQAQKERNVLAHQSSLLMGEISSNETLMKVLLEVEDLKRKLEEETQNHALEVQRLQEKLEYRETEAQLEVVEEKLRLAEEELLLALQRAEKAEEAQSELEAKISELKLKTEGNSAPAPPPLPPPPPPPPLPPMMPASNPVFKRPEKALTHRESIDDMANILGIQRTPKSNIVNGGAINDIINEIKGGKFTLKATEKQKMKKEEPPPAVQEMLNIIGTLKRRPGRSNPSSPDVQV